MKKEELLKKYLNAFVKLKRATKNGIKAPHKPLLLLAILQLILKGEIFENKIKITPQLVAQYADNWKWLVKESFFKQNFALPFYHLKSEGFWHLKLNIGQNIELTSSLSIKSFSQLNESIEYAYFDETLFALLMQVEAREILYQFLLKHYFGTESASFVQVGIIEEVADQILHEPSGIYKQIIEKSDEEEIFIRCAVFKKLIPQIYNYTCSFSGMRIISEFDIQMIDACHIVPFAISHNDTISNGLSLSPTFHRAFDRGLVAIDKEYKIILSSSFTESISSISIKSYEGKFIQLPEEPNYFPSQENLKWHRENIFKI